MTEYRMKAVMFASLTHGGSMQIAEAVDYPGVVRTAVDYPGVVRTAVKETRDSQWEVIIAYNGKDYPTLEEAIQAYKAETIKDML